MNPEEKTVSLILLPNPFDLGSREFHSLPYRDLATIPEYFQDFAHADQYAVSLNGALLPLESVSLTRPCPGDQLIVCPIIAGGGDDGKNIGAMIGMIAVMIVAVVVGQVWVIPTLGPVLGGLTVAAIGMGGSMLVNALVPPGKADTLETSGVGGDLAGSAVYGWNGLRTMAMQGGSIPVVYGTHRVPGNVIRAANEIKLALG